MASSASATLDDCNVSDSAWACVLVSDRGTGNLSGCTLYEGVRNALQVLGTGTNVHATKFHFRQNRKGAVVSGGATLTAVACKSSQNSIAGFAAIGKAGAPTPVSVLELIDCTSDSNGVGCSACHGEVRATRVEVTNSSGTGYDVGPWGNMVLTDCSAEYCQGHGVYSSVAAKVNAEGCTFQQNGAYGVLAVATAEVTVKGCHSFQHTTAGFCSVGGAQMKVSSSVSEGDKQGCSVDDTGQLTMEDVTVDGTLQSGPRHGRCVW